MSHKRRQLCAILVPTAQHVTWGLKAIKTADAVIQGESPPRK